MKNFNGSSHTIDIINRSMLQPIYFPGLPPLDSEMNFMLDQLNENLAEEMRNLLPSGWLNLKLNAGDDDNGDNFEVNFTLQPNKLILNSLSPDPFKANVNGWVVPVGGTNSTVNNKLEIELDDAPALGSRQDLVFLEVWSRQIASGDTEGKPSATEIFTLGNTQYGGVNLLEDIAHPLLAFTTTERVQLQYRIRVVNGVNFNSFPNGVDDPTVLAQGGADSPVIGQTFDFMAPTDSGLYRAGDGVANGSALKTTDGFVYAIPMFRIHRRNSSPYSLANLNGSANQLSDGVSDRVDGLYYDQIVLGDVEDLRHNVAVSYDFREMLNSNLNKLYSGELATKLVPLRDSDNYQTYRSLWVDDVSPTDLVGSERIGSPNTQRRYFGDKNEVQDTVSAFNVFDKTFGTVGGDWQVGDQITITVGTASPAGTVLDLGSIAASTVYQGEIYNITLGAIAAPGVYEILNLGGLPSPGANPPSDILVNYGVEYPAGENGLSKQPEQILEVELREGTESRKTDHMSDNGDIVEVFLPNADITQGLVDAAYAHRPSIEEKGFTSLIDKFILGNGSATYDIPLDKYYDEHLLRYVHSIQNLSTNQFIDPSSVIITEPIFGSGDYVLRITLPSSISVLFKVTLAIDKDLLLIQETTKSVEDLYRVQELILDVTAASSVSFAINEVVLAKQTRWTSASTASVPVYQDTCYVDNSQIDCTTSISNGNLTISFGAPVTGEVKLYALTTKTLVTSDDSLIISYKYFPYQGIASQPNFGMAPTDDIVETLVVQSLGSLTVTTDGTGEVGDLVTEIYKTLSLKLPRSAVFGDYLLKNDPLGPENSDYELVLNNPIISGLNGSTHYVEGAENYLIKRDIEANVIRGAVRGSQFASVGKLVASVSGSKMVISAGLEKVISDTSNNFVPGELALRVDTTIIPGPDPVVVANEFDIGLADNQATDLFRIKGRPIIR